jgi:hypothetical protein
MHNHPTQFLLRLTRTVTLNARSHKFAFPTVTARNGLAAQTPTRPRLLTVIRKDSGRSVPPELTPCAAIRETETRTLF